MPGAYKSMKKRGYGGGGGGAASDGSPMGSIDYSGSMTNVVVANAGSAGSLSARSGGKGKKGSSKSKRMNYGKGTAPSY